MFPDGGGEGERRVRFVSARDETGFELAKGVFARLFRMRKK